MTDNDVLDIVLSNTTHNLPPHSRVRLEMLVQLRAKEMWREREVSHMQVHGKGAYCDCLFFRTGDFVAAYQKAIETMRANGELT